MNTLTKKDKLALQVSLALVAGMFSLVPVVQGAPVLDKVVSGGATVSQTTSNVTAIQSSNTNNIIDWKDFSVGSSEKVVFDATDAAGSSYNKTNNYLNVVTGNGTSYINGKVQGGNNVYLVNPNGVIMGKNADIDVGNLYVSTKKLTNEATLAANNTTLSGASVLQGTVNEEVVNMGKIQANSVYAEGTSIRFLNTADVTSNGTTPLTGVVLNGTDYVHVGYEAASIATAENSGSSGEYASPTSTNAATTLAYKINGTTLSATKFNSGVNDYDYALVRNGVELQNMNSNKSLNYMLSQDITLSGTFTPIGDGNTSFTGNFDGNYFTISGLSDVTGNHTYTGFIGKAEGTSEKHSTIMNVGIIDAALTGKAGGYVGGVAGYINYVDLQNVYNKSTTPSDPSTNIGVLMDSSTVKPYGSSYRTYFVYTGKVGGVVGHASNSAIDGVYNTGKVTTGAGIVGELVSSTLQNAYNAGLVVNNRDYTSTISADSPTIEQHYAIVDKISDSTVKNVYGSGKYSVTDASTTTSTLSALVLAPSTSSFTNAYIIDNSNTTPSMSVVQDTASAYYKNGSAGTRDAQSADSYGFFESTQSNNTYVASSKSSDGVWRIYDGHTLPLLRSFLKANGYGTVPVSYTYNLYATESATSPTLSLSGSNADGTVTYNGYYIGVSGATTDTVRGLSASKIGSDASVRAKNVESTLTAFYSTGQDGYDLAGDTLRIVARNLTPSASRTDIDKVYDGTSDAAAALEDNLFEKIDLRNYSTDPGYGIVQVYDASGNLLSTQDDVSLADGFITSATYDDGPNVTTDSNITFTVDSDVAALTGDDAGNYTLSASDLTNISLSGDITQRPVLVSLNTSTGLDKVYDGTSYVVYNGSTTEATDGTVSHGMNNVNVAGYSSTANTGLITNDGVSVVLSDAYYSTDGTAANKVSNAGGTYKATYALALSGDATKVANYKLQDSDGNDLTGGILTGTGSISKRNVTLDNIAILDSSGNVITDASKTYDFTSNYADANDVTFTTGSVATEVKAVNQTLTEGVLAADEDSFNFGLTSATFYNEAGDAEAKTVSDAKQVKYVLSTAGDADVLSNYTLNGNDIEDGSVSFFRDGEITKRAITIDMVTSSDIDKIYDNTADVVDKDSKGYLGFKGTGATGTVSETSSAPTLTTKGYVGYGTNTANKLVVDDVDSTGKSLNDGTTFAISAAYTTAGADNTGSTTNAADVYYVDSDHVAEDKKITYTVTLAGDYADNYTLNGESATTSGDTTTGPTAELSATGAITPRQITGITFGDVTKSYDGSAAVGEVNGVTQSRNQITIAGVTIDTSDGVTANDSGLLGTDTYDAVLGTTDGVLANSSTITGNYGTPGWTTASTEAFAANAHAYSGTARKVQYTGVSSITSDNHNYTTVGMDDTQYGNGTITPLTIDNLSASGDGNISKIYDGTNAVVGGYQIQYQTSTSTNTGGETDIVGVLVKHQNDASDVKTALGTITGSGTGVDGNSTVSLAFGSGDYSVDTTNTVYNSTHVDDAANITYAVTLNNTYGDYVLAASTDATNSGYVSYGTNGAKIVKTNTGLITARNVYTQGVTGLSKTYDGGTDVKDSDGNVLTGDSVVTFNAKDDVSGLVGNDGVTNASTAVYSGDSRTGYEAKDANVYTDGIQTSVNGAKSVTYTVKLSGDNAHGDYVIYKNTNGDSYYAPGTEYTLSGNNIKQADLQVAFGAIAKTYDTNSNVTTATLNPAINAANNTGTVTDGTFTVANTAGTDSVALAIQDTSAFLAGTTENASAAASDVGTHQVQYDLVSTSSDLKNYRLVGSDGTTALTVSKNNDGSYNVTAYGTGTISPLTIDSIAAAIDDVTKIYDGTASLTYDHTAADGYDSTQQGSASSGDFVHSLTLGSLTITEGFTVNEDGTGYTSTGTGSTIAGVGTGKIVTYSLTIDKDVIKNLTIGDGVGGTRDSAGNYTLTKTTTNNAITAKNAYAYLSSDGLAADPTKIYDGTTDVNDTGIASYVTVNGLASGDSATITAAYESKDVAVENGAVVASKNNIDYTVALGTNYNLYTVDDSGNIFTHNASHVTTDTGYNYDKATGNLTSDANSASVLGTGNNMSALVASPTNVLVGTGTITPKEITLDATLAQKIYDADAAVKFTNLDTSATEDSKKEKAPVFTLTGLVHDGDLTVATTGTNAISGKYGNYANGTFTEDANVALDSNSTPTYKAVQYSGVSAALTAENSAVTNYKLVDSSATNSVYNATDDTWTFTADAEKGKITKRGISNITSEFGTITKEYDATEAVLNPTEGFKVWGVYGTGANDKVSIAYNLDQAVYGTLNANQDGLASTNKDAGTNLDVSYKISGLKAEALQNFELDTGVTAEGYNKWFTTHTGSITPRVISGKATDAIQEKIYDGSTSALSNTDYFNIDADDLAILNKDGKDSSALTVSAAYEDKNYSISPTATAEGGKDVYFTIGWASGQSDTGYQSNYTFDTNNGIGTDYTGSGDIRQRIVYVTDNGGTVQAKTYNGSEALPGTVSTTKFTDADAAGSTGIIDSDVALSQTVNGAYVDKNVERDSSGNVINKAVSYSGFALTDSDTTDNDGFNESNNYYLMADPSVTSVALTDSDNNTVNSAVTSTGGGDSLVITEAKGGLITPKEVTISIASPEKTYDATTKVEAADLAGSNLTAKADGQDVSKHFDSANNAVLELNPGTGTDEVTVKVNSGSYDTKNVSVDENGNVLSNKVTTLNVSWNNGNYDLVAAGGEEDGTAGQADDTFKMNGTKGYTNGYTSNTDERTGVLKDYQSTINPLELTVSSISSGKTYDGTTGYSYGLDGSPVTNTVSVSFGEAADAVIQKDIDMSDDTTLNNTGFLGLTVANGTYGTATDPEVAAVASDAAKDENSDPFEHSTTYSGIAIDSSNPNYKLTSASASGTGIINRATVTATPDPQSSTIKQGQSLPSYTGELSGFMAVDEDGGTNTMPWSTTSYVYDDDGNQVFDDDGNPVTNTTTTNISVAEYYKRMFTWGPDSNVTSSSAGTHSVYGWYSKTETVDGEAVTNYYKESNLGKNYVLAQAPGELVIERVYSGGGGGTVTPTPNPDPTPTPDPTPEPSPTPTPDPEPTPTPTPEPEEETVIVPTADVGYVEQPTVPDSNVYQNVSKDESNTTSHDAAAAIQYGENTTAISSEKGETSSSGTIAIEVADVVNLVGSDVASDGTMSLTNTAGTSALSVDSTEEGYLSVGTAESLGEDGLGTEEGSLSLAADAEDGADGTEGSISIENDDETEGTIGLETEDGTSLIDDNEEGASRASSGRTARMSLSNADESSESSESSENSENEESQAGTAGEEEELSDYGLQSQMVQDEEDEDKEDEDKDEEEETEEKEGEAAITYGDVA